MSRKSSKYDHVILEEDADPSTMTTQQLQSYGHSRIAETDAALVRAKRSVAETNALAADTYSELKNQTSQVCMAKCERRDAIAALLLCACTKSNY